MENAESKDIQDDTQKEEQEAPKMFTQDELEKHIADRLAKERAKVQREQAEAQRKADDAKKLELLQGEERLKEEFRLQREQIERERDEAQRELAISKVRADLSVKGYGDVATIAPNLLGADERETAENISAFDKMIQKLVADQVGQSLHRGAPPVPQGASGNTLRDEIRKAAGLMR